MPRKVCEMFSDATYANSSELASLLRLPILRTLSTGFLFLTLTLSFAGCSQNDANHSADGLVDIDGIETDDVENSKPAQDADESVPEHPSRLAKFETEPAPIPLKQPVNRVSSTIPRPAADPAEEVFQRLIDARKNSNPTDWEQSERELEQLGKSAVPVLVKGLQSPDVDMRELATMWLVRLGPEAENIENDLASVLDDESDFVRVNAASALSHLPDHADRVIPILTQLLEHPEFSVKITAATALGNAGELASSAVPALAASLQGEEDLQLAVLSTLSRIGPAAESALPSIANLWQTTSSEMVKASAEEAYRTIQGESK